MDKCVHVLEANVSSRSTISDQNAEKDAIHWYRDTGRQSHWNSRVHQGLQAGVKSGRQDVHRVQNRGGEEGPCKETLHGFVIIIQHE